MRFILIDTNFWLLPFEKGLDVLSLIERMSDDEPLTYGITQPVLNELEAMARGPLNGKRTRPAKAALRAIEQLVTKGKAVIFPYEGPADGSLITVALQKNAWVATNDRALKFRLKDKKIKVVSLRDEHKLDFG